MKTRSGFVSNSSSTSFTCDVCGTTESGWDASASDCGMCECEVGHVFCEGHQKDGIPKPTTEEMRQKLLDNVQAATWTTDEEKAKDSFRSYKEFIQFIKPAKE